jgi:hypothetical protein
MNEILRGSWPTYLYSEGWKYGGVELRLQTNETTLPAIDARKPSQIVKRRFRLNLTEPKAGLVGRKTKHQNH